MLLLNNKIKYLNRYLLTNGEKLMKLFLATLILICSLNVFGQTDTTYWKTGGDFSIQMNQSYFENWAAGGEKSWALGSILNAFAKYKYEKHSWDNTLFVGLGYVSTASNNTRKTDDKIEFNSKYGRKLSDAWYAAGQLNFKTQMFEGFKYQNTGDLRISDFMAPGYLNVSIGVDYKPNDDFSIFYSPVSGRFIFVLDDSLSSVGAFGVEVDQKIRPELGSYFVLQSKYEIFENVIYQTKLDLFWNYTPEDPDTQLYNIDVMWDNSILMKVNSWLSVIFTANIIYDHDIFTVDSEGNKEWLQLKQTLGVGITFKY